MTDRTNDPTTEDPEPLSFHNGILADVRGAILTGLPENVTALPDPNRVGIFLRFTAEKSASRLVFSAGRLSGVRRFTLCHRYEPFWMTAKAGTGATDIPPETQFLLAEREDGTCLLLVPLVDSVGGVFRCSLEGASDGETLNLIAETGDEGTVGNEVIGLFVATGNDPFLATSIEPFALMEAAADSVAMHLKSGRLRRDKSLPDFVNYFGWCTWDAFYQDVSHEKVREGLESFRAGGIEPKYLILDDGWQSVRPFPNDEKRLTAFAANEKFPGDLGVTVRMAKEEYSVRTFLVWHAVGGYWGGVDDTALPSYDIRSTDRQYNAAITNYAPGVLHWFGTACGVVPPEHIYRFYQDYHRHLRLQGVDGVKVDNQASLEGLSQGIGGRVPLMRAYHEALEGSGHVHFNGNLINCMSCANEMLYGALNSTLTRTSTDFWPKKPESHGLHLYVNAQVSSWFGEFIHPDWDMFQSGHEMGAYHAAGRAVSGGPVYVSDKPGIHDFDLLRKLVLPDGRVLRGTAPGRPARDCLFHDPTREDVLLKIWNVNPHGGVLGAFHARYGDGVGNISGVVRPADIPGYAIQEEIKRRVFKEEGLAEGALDLGNPFGLPSEYIVFAHYADELRILSAEGEWPVTLAPLTAEVFTIVRKDNDVVPVGLTEIFNSAGGIVDATETEDGWYISLHVGGRFTAWCRREPRLVLVHDEAGGHVDCAVAFDEATGRLDVRFDVDAPAPVVQIQM
jgi:raffinose synthase